MAIGSDYKYSRKSLFFRAYFSLFGTPDLHTHLRLSPFLRKVSGAMKQFKISRIFEPGCGRGINAFEIAKLGLRPSYLGNDFSAQDIASAQRIAKHLNLKHVRFTHADVMAATPKDYDYDAVLLLDIIEHIPNDADFVQTIVGNSAQDCIFFVSVPTKTYPKVFGRSYHNKVGHVRDGYDVSEIKALFDYTGARLIYHSYSTGLVARLGCYIYYRLHSNSKLHNALLGLIVLPFRYLDLLNSKSTSCSLFCIFAKGHLNR